HAAAGEQVEAAHAGEVLAEPVEQGLAHAVGGRAQPGDAGDVDQTRAPESADDANPAHRSAPSAAAAGREGAPAPPPGAAPASPSPSPPAITVTRYSGRMRRAKASRTCSAVTAETARG